MKGKKPKKVPNQKYLFCINLDFNKNGKIAIRGITVRYVFSITASPIQEPDSNKKKILFVLYDLIELIKPNAIIAE